MTTQQTIDDISDQFERVLSGARARASGAPAQLNAVAVPEQSPAAPQQSPAVPQQSPAVPQQSPAVPEQSPALPEQSPAVAERSPLINEYVRLATLLANRMTVGELQAGIENMKQELDLRDALTELSSVRESLQKIVASHPESQAAAQARRVLSGIDARPLGP